MCLQHSINRAEQMRRRSSFRCSFIETSVTVQKNVTDSSLWWRQTTSAQSLQAAHGHVFTRSDSLYSPSDLLPPGQRNIRTAHSALSPGRQAGEGRDTQHKDSPRCWWIKKRDFFGPVYLVVEQVVGRRVGGMKPLWDAAHYIALARVRHEICMACSNVWNIKYSHYE